MSANTFTSEQIVLVTGASSGIGYGVARLLNEQGATVIAHGRDEQKLLKAQYEAAFPENWHIEVCDFLADMESLPLWVTELRKKYGKFWGMVHAAGEGLMDSLQLYDLQQAQRHFDINFHVPLLLAKGFSDRRNFIKGGAMLFLTSSSAVYPEKGHLLYGAAKSALATAAKVMSQEMVTRELRVHCLAPGIVDTPLQKQAENAMGAHYREEQLARYPLGFGTVEDIAHMSAFLLSEKSRWITGQNFVMGGGCY